MSLADVCWNISSVFVCIFDHDDKNDKSSKE